MSMPAHIFSILLKIIYLFIFELSSFELTWEGLKFRATLEVLDFPNSQLKYF